MVKSKMIWDGTGVAAAVKDIEPYFCCTSLDYQQKKFQVLKLYKQKGPFKEWGGIILFMWFSKLKKSWKELIKNSFREKLQ